MAKGKEEPKIRFSSEIGWLANIIINQEDKMSNTEQKLEHPRLRVEEGKGVPEHEGYTDDKIERRKFRENKPFIVDKAYFNSEATKDGILHFAHGMGDDNPLWCDEDYAIKTKYGSIIAPPSYLYSIQWVPMGSLIAGVHAWYSGGDWEWYRPIFVGDRFKSVCILRENVEKKGKMAGGGSIFIGYTDVVYVNQKDEIVAKELQHTVSTGRSEAGGAGKYRQTPKPVYSREDWKKMLDMYENEEVRGAEPRYWEDVNVGDKLGPMIKGPLTVRDMIGWLMGAGSPFFRAHKIEYDYEKRHPSTLEFVEETGEADVPELVHIFDAFARTIGVERAYDYGHQRMSWLCNFFTNWMGDDGYLWKMSGDLRVFNQVGDVTTFEGKIVKKYIEDEKCCVDIEAGAKNQRGENSMPPNVSTVVLPSREHGAVKYTVPKESLIDEVAKAQPLKEMIAKGLI